MFDISFTELMLIGVVALVVIGPERLPKVARTVGHLLGRAQRYVNDVKGDIQREVELDELRKMKEEMESAARSVQSSIHQTENELKENLQSPVDEMKADFESVVNAPAATQESAQVGQVKPEPEQTKQAQVAEPKS